MRRCATDRRGDAREPARPAGAAAGARAGGARRRLRAAGRAAASGRLEERFRSELERCPTRRSACCSRGGGARSATRRCSGARPRSSTSASRRRCPRRRPACSSRARASRFAIRSFAPRCTARRPERAARRASGACGSDRSRASIPIAAPGTAHRRHPGPTKWSPPSSSDPPTERRPAVVSRPRPPFSSGRPD